jgi:cytochrome o ubiquinol oxidase subunit 2
VKTLSRVITFLFIIADLYLLGKIVLNGKNFQVLNPKGLIALQEKDLIITSLFMMFLVVIPVFIFAIYVATTYHEGNKYAKYMPDWDHNTKLQIALWAFPSAIIAVLCVLNWVVAHKLDPHVAIASTTKPLIVQVVATRWKWIFIYPEQKIATVNLLEIPEKTPIDFELTASDTPMNSFWIPQLGGQIYAMSGMATQTHLIADGVGQYRGQSAEINGAGFSDMNFTVKSVPQNMFNYWVGTVRQSSDSLTYESFKKLAEPSMDNPITYYSSVQDNLYTTIVMQYMAQPTLTPDHKSSGL